MKIESIHELIEIGEGVIYVSALIEDVVLTHNQTLYDPAEYGSALCESTFILSEDDILPDNENELIQFLENLDLDWVTIDNSDDYFE